MKGKFIAIYGTNGIGKTTQVEKLVEFLCAQGKKAFRLKYPVYDLAPEGPFIFKYLRDPKFRKKNELSPLELQRKYVANRRSYEKYLKKRIENGEWIIAEDYAGTGVAWGLTWGADLENLERANEGLFKPDLEILMHGERFLTAVEKDHRNEMEPERIKICKNFHLLLAQKNDWKIVNANQSIKKVQSDIVKIIKKANKI